MKIVAAGGGSGGHVTPALAVINELAKHDDDLSVCFVTDGKFFNQASDIMKRASVDVKMKRITAGKFRRYHKVSVVRQLFDIPTVLQNIRDLFYNLIGFVQSYLLLLRVKPDVVFTKGGFVCVPLGLAAHLRKIPLVIHDSDAHPGLANRILARWATVIATGSPLENYSYPAAKSHYTGIPVDAIFKPVTKKQQATLKGKLGFHDTSKPLVVVTGGGLGARNINRATVMIAPKILENAAILQVTGTATYEETIKHASEHIDYKILPFVSGMAGVFGAADVVVTRAGATTLQELAAMAKPTIIVPNPLLTGGHQLKNAEVYRKAKAAYIIEEDDLVYKPATLQKAIEVLLKHPEICDKMAKSIHAFAKPEAAVDVAALVTEAAAARKMAK